MTTATQEVTKPAPAKGIVVTEKALAKVRSAMAKEGISPEQGGLRLGVQGGGCSGLSYNIRFDTQPRERDRIFQFDDVRVFVDPKSFIYLHGLILAYQETLLQQGLVVVNPHATNSRDRGTSFSACGSRVAPPLLSGRPLHADLRPLRHRTQGLDEPSRRRPDGGGGAWPARDRTRRGRWP